LEAKDFLARKPADQSVNRDDILLAAADVLQRNGYEATTMKDIAAAVNLTAASLYHHFRNKDALLLAVLEAGLEQVTFQIEPILNSPQPSDQKLRRMIHEHVVSLTQNTAVGAAMVFEIRSLMGVKPMSDFASVADKQSYAEFVTRRDAFFIRRDQFENLFRQVIREGIDNKTFRAVDVAIFTKTILGAHNWVGVWYKPGGRLDGQQIADMMADWFLRALQP
jgi:TetR/AcrR family transcriptional regulator, cholesterol catabolism regulator